MNEARQRNIPFIGAPGKNYVRQILLRSETESNAQGLTSDDLLQSGVEKIQRDCELNCDQRCIIPLPMLEQLNIQR